MRSVLPWEDFIKCGSVLLKKILTLLKYRLVHLDCLRGMGALLVCEEHLRAFLFVPYARLESPGVVQKGFYFLTGLGHQSVMIFFVLSGFLVGGSVVVAMRKGNWTWNGYLLRRLWGALMLFNGLL